MAGADALQRRSEASSVVYGGKYYVFLGFGNSDLVPVATSEVYDPNTGSWQLLAPIAAGKAMTHQGVALLGDEVWHIGGRVGKHPGVLTSEIWIYHINSDSWSQGPSLINPATGGRLLWGGGGAAFVGNILHVWGGFAGTACNGDQSSFHLTLDVAAWRAQPTQPAAWQNVAPPMPMKRNHFGTVLLNGKIYVLGGQTGHDCGGGLDQRWVHVFDPVANTWQRLADLPEPRSHIEGSSFALDGKIYVLGGQVANNANTRKVTVFDPQAAGGAGQWNNADSLVLPAAFEGPGTKVIGATLLFSHGGAGSSRNPSLQFYHRPIQRNPLYRLLLPSTCTPISVQPGGSTQQQTLLFTTDSTAVYTLQSTVPWLVATSPDGGTVTPNGTLLGYAVDAAGLTPGIYNGSLKVMADGFAEATLCVTLQVGTQQLEAETAARKGGVLATYNPGYTGSGYIDFKNATGDYIEWTATMPVAQTMELQIRYANGGTANRPMRLSINGTVVTQSLAFPVTGSFRNWAYSRIKVNLAAGPNKIRITANGASGPNTDHLVVAAPVAKPMAVGKQAANADPPPAMTVAPNPAIGTTRVLLNWIPKSPLVVQIVDAMGTVHRQFSYAQLGEPAFTVSLAGLRADTYVLVLRSGTVVLRRRLLVLP